LNKPRFWVQTSILVSHEGRKASLGRGAGIESLEPSASNRSKRTKRTNAFVHFVPTVYLRSFFVMPLLDPGYGFFEAYSRGGASGKPSSYPMYGREVRCVVGHHQMNAVCLSCRSCSVNNYNWSRGIRTWVGVQTSRLRATGPKYRTAYDQYKASHDKLSEKVKENAQMQHQTAPYQGERHPRGNVVNHHFQTDHYLGLANQLPRKRFWATHPIM
jgi:hypothetical protein